MRIGEWAESFNIRVRSCEERPDNPPGDIVYRVKEVFTTRDGSWEMSNKPGSIPDWARSEHLRPFGATDYFDDAGGDHHLFARILDVEGRPVTDQDLVIYWSDGFHRLGDAGYQGHVRVTPKEGSGWANQVVFNSFNPDRGERGAWCWCPQGAADVVEGGGLPNNQHVSFFAVWQAELRQTALDTTTDTDASVDADDDDSALPMPDLNDLRNVVWSAVGVPYDPHASFIAYARQRKLGAPLTAAFDYGEYRVQGFANGIVFARKDQLDRPRHRRW